MSLLHTLQIFHLNHDFDRNVELLKKRLHILYDNAIKIVDFHKDADEIRYLFLHSNEHLLRNF